MRNPFRTPTAQELAQRQLLEAERDLLTAEANKEHFTAQVDMLRKRVERLRAQCPADELPAPAIPRQLLKAAA